MGGADGVDADFAEGFEAALPDAERNGGAERAAVFVEADAFDFEVAAVEPEAGGGVEFEVADAEGMDSMSAPVRTSAR